MMMLMLSSRNVQSFLTSRSPSSSRFRNSFSTLTSSTTSSLPFQRLSTPSQRFSSSSFTLLSAVSKKDSYAITVLPGDGIGPEITEATLGVLQALQERAGDFTLHMTTALIGGAALDAVNHPFPPETLAQIQQSDSVLLACIGGYKWDANPRELRPETGLLSMRKSLQLFANLRPAKVMPQLLAASTLKPEIIQGVDIMVVRELTGDVYFGQPKGIEMRNGTYVRVDGCMTRDRYIQVCVCVCVCL